MTVSLPCGALDPLVRQKPNLVPDYLKNVIAKIMSKVVVDRFEGSTSHISSKKAKIASSSTLLSIGPCEAAVAKSRVRSISATQ
jgi:hypothetical protein